LVGKPEGKRQFVRPRRGWENNNTRRDRREIGWDYVDWINQAQDGDQWQAILNTEMKLRVP